VLHVSLRPAVLSRCGAFFVVGRDSAQFLLSLAAHPVPMRVLQLPPARQKSRRSSVAMLLKTMSLQNRPLFIKIKH
jgi:hypothetical protein